MSGNTPHDNWSKVFHYILSKNLGDKFLELSKEDLSNILHSMDLLTRYCLAPYDKECQEIEDFLEADSAKK